MIDYDYAPTVFAAVIAFATFAPFFIASLWTIMIRKVLK